ncbi:VaFE repeat-containing surface-anchored protein, partial [Corynebacterium sp.]|uniref:VaFE repeat-containing surface-anchored protein n=1 Tax=Corynebacterium sp. TaxID=1720 RepID=UPI0027B8C555
MLAAIAVIAAMVTVPWGKAQAEESAPTDFVPNETLGAKTDDLALDESWGPLVWAGKPTVTGFHKGNPANNVGWAWCIDATAAIPMQTNFKYSASTAGKAPIQDEFRDGAINVAMKLRDAVDRGDKVAARNYSVYMSALLASTAQNQKAAALTITGDDYKYDNPYDQEWYPTFKEDGGSAEEFKQLTGLDINTTRSSNGFDVEFVRDPSVDVPKAPAGAYITIVGPNGQLGGDPNGQRVMPPDQPGLPDGGGGHETPDVPVPGTETPTTETSEKPTPKNPSIKTEAEFAKGSKKRVVNGAVVTDTVTYEGLVAGKKYHLDAKLMSKDGKSVLGDGEAEFTAAEDGNGSTTVDITVKNAEQPVDAAVAFEELTSVEVNAEGDETPGAETPNEIADHKNLEDEDQTVTSKKALTPSIKTEAEFAKGSKKRVV